MIIIETNSCPSGQKSMPLISEKNEENGYLTLIKKTFKPYLDELKTQGKLMDTGYLAVVYVLFDNQDTLFLFFSFFFIFIVKTKSIWKLKRYDKNEMEASGYASVIAGVFKEDVGYLFFFLILFILFLFNL